MKRVLGWILVGGLLAAGCSPSESGTAKGPEARTAKGPIRAVCTTGMVAELVRHVGGKYVEVTQLMGEGVDPHLYKASPGDIRTLSAAEVIFASGLHLEGKMGDVFARMASRKPVCMVAERIPEDKLLKVTGGHLDPHVWFDVALWSEGLEAVRETLAKMAPDHAADFADGAKSYRAELLELDQACRERLATVAKERRVLVTAHDAFHYFGRTYGIEVRAVQGISTESEAGVRDINDLVEFLVARKIRAVFVESSVSDANLRALVEGCGARGHAVRIGGSLFSDAMGKPGTPEGTYVGMVRHNVETIVKALQ